jgi:hypothetical protein
MNLFNEINRVTNDIYGGFNMKESWYMALDKKGRRLGLIHARNEEHAMEKARHEYGLAVIEVEYVKDEELGRALA